MAFPGFPSGFPHGFPGFFPGGPPAPASGPRDTAHYATLGVDPGASAATIKAAYHKLAKTHHPDRGGDPDTFKRVSVAYDVIGDPQKREQYDRGQAVDDRAPPQQQVAPQIHAVDVTIGEIFAGATKRLVITRTVVDRTAQAQTCGHCRGAGHHVQQSIFGLTHVACPGCGGQGRMTPTKTEERTLEVVVPRGAADGHRIFFAGEGDEHPGAARGDVVVELRLASGSAFRRRGADLFVDREIQLVDALCGVETTIESIDGRRLGARTRPGEVLQPSSCDPFDEPDAWELLADTACRLPSIAQARTDDPAVLYRAVATELRGHAIGCIVTRGGAAEFFAGSRDECLAARIAVPGATMHVVAAPRACPMPCLVGEGLPVAGDPTTRGNLYVNFAIIFPARLDHATVDAVRGALGGAPQSTAGPDDVFLETRDADASYRATRSPDEAVDDEPTPQQQCHQQ